MGVLEHYEPLNIMDYALKKITEAIDSLGTEKLRVKITDPLPSGENTIGYVKLVGYDSENNTWRNILVDSTGRVRATLL